MKLLKILSRIGLVLLIVVAAVVVFRAILNYTEGRALSRALARLKAEGVPLTAKELATACPDEDNAARLWKAFENIVTIPGRAAGNQASRSRRDKVAVGKLIGRAWTDFTSGRPLAQADKAALRDVILENRKAFELLTQMGDKPCFLYRDPAGPLLESLTPSAIQSMQTAKLLCFAAILSAEDGDMGGAVDRLVTGLKFAPLMAREGTLIAFLVPLAETRLLAWFAGEAARGRAIGEADLDRLMNALDPGPWRERLAWAFRGERVMSVEMGQYALRGGLNDLGSVYEGRSWLRNLGLWVIRPLIMRDIRYNLPEYGFLETQAKAPYYRSREPLRARQLELDRRPWYAYWSKLLIDNFEVVFMKEALTEATLLAARTGLACRLYRSRVGSYPGSLGALVPGILKEVPVDPFTGQPFVYRRDGEGFIVYSLGSNQKDDGGRSTYMITQLVMEKDDDVPWRETR
ncbi:MAG: hypothetical protein ABFD52_08280 [Acidobacteriota bacterium]